MTDHKDKILIVEDDLDVADMINAFFNIHGYDVRTVNWGEDALRVCQEEEFDLIILDIRLPDIDGFEVARRLRQNRRTANIPIIFLTEKRARADRLHGLELGADDYVTKPFDSHELRLRVRNAIQRSVLGVEINPVTQFPEGDAFFAKAAAHISQPVWAVLLVRLENLDLFRATYGFIFADEVMRATSFMLNNLLHEEGSPEDLIGMYRSTQFLVLTQPVHVSALIERINNRVEQSLLYFYPLQDRERVDLHNRLAVRLTAVSSEDGLVPDLEALNKRLAV